MDTLEPHLFKSVYEQIKMVQGLVFTIFYNMSHNNNINAGLMYVRAFVCRIVRPRLVHYVKSRRVKIWGTCFYIMTVCKRLMSHISTNERKVMMIEKIDVFTVLGVRFYCNGPTEIIVLSVCTHFSVTEIEHLIVRLTPR